MAKKLAIGYAIALAILIAYVKFGYVATPIFYKCTNSYKIENTPACQAEID